MSEKPEVQSVENAPLNVGELNRIKDVVAINCGPSVTIRFIDYQYRYVDFTLSKSELLALLSK